MTAAPRELPAEGRGHEAQHRWFDSYSMSPEGWCWLGDFSREALYCVPFLLTVLMDAVVPSRGEHRYFFYSLAVKTQPSELNVPPQALLAITTILQASIDGLFSLSSLDVAPTASIEQLNVE